MTPTGRWCARSASTTPGWVLLAPEQRGVTLECIMFTFVLADPRIVSAQVHHYTGMDGTPGLVMRMAWPRPRYTS